jgi:hypothetical protein
MTTAGTWYYPPCAGTGNLLLANPPFIFHLMDTNQPTPIEGLPMLTEEEFAQFSQEAGGSGMFEACNYAHAFRIAQRAYQLGADAELWACSQWLAIGGPRGSTCHHSDLQNAQDLRAFRRPKPPTLKEQALAILNDCNLDAAHENALRRALEALPE